MNLTEFKSKFIKQLKALYTTKVILPAYSDIAQRNAGLAGGDAVMLAWINVKKADIQAIEDQINALGDTELLDNLSLSANDATRFSYVTSYLSACNTDERKLITLLALQNIKVLG